MKLTRRATLISLSGYLAACATPPPARISLLLQSAAAIAAMKRATTFMTDVVAYQGGYVWSYLPDFSRVWGEMEAQRSMLWIQPPGTATMGHAYLDAYHATGDRQFWEAAAATTRALAAAQHPSGGWNYMFDAAGESALKNWYATIGANGWRLEEFQHYYGNATFDDAGTSEASQLMLRMHLEGRSREFRAPLERAIGFVLDSQYPIGGWPQRFPFAPPADLHGMADYTRHITFNDDVAGENIKFMIMVAQTLGDVRMADAISRAMNAFKITQQPKPQPAWGLQHNVGDLKPAGARSYEPLAFVTHTTANNIAQLMNFYELTGERSFLARVGEGLDWLDEVRLPASLATERRTHPTFIEIGSNKPLYVHRRGSNVVNGEYYVTDQLDGAIGHYSPTRVIHTDHLRERFARLDAARVQATSGNALLSRSQPLPRFFTTRSIEVSDLNSNQGLDPQAALSEDDTAKILAALNSEGWWPTPLVATSNPFAGSGSLAPAPGDYSQTRVGDQTDTSPYITDKPPTGISVGSFIQNMAQLTEYVAV
jgi:PelA/Pel-15E family pectate lyase